MFTITEGTTVYSMNNDSEIVYRQAERFHIQILAWFLAMIQKEKINILLYPLHLLD